MLLPRRQVFLSLGEPSARQAWRRGSFDIIVTVLS